ncbi:DUF3263 domain-containing protein [Streptomyces sp. NPDC051644]|uniref:DUF3263 domain-containing protein n=1 Tax=Streptomyces sp. NPDC051644 TaxID=3365666 RepID=UPI003797801E
MSPVLRGEGRNPRPASARPSGVGGPGITRRHARQRLRPALWPRWLLRPGPIPKPTNSSFRERHSATGRQPARSRLRNPRRRPAPGLREQYIHDKVGLLPCVYFQLLKELLDDPHAESTAPATITALRTRRVSRARSI